jgi:hypothetical protein
MRRVPHIGVDVQCRTCGKTFKVPNCEALTAKYCSRECMHIGHRKSVTKPCFGCGKPVTRRPSSGGKNKRWFCSTECLNNWQRSQDSPLKVVWTDPQKIKNATERLTLWRKENPHPLLGKHHSDATKRKIALAHSKPPNLEIVLKHRKGVRQSQNNTIECAREKLGGICQLCKTKEKLEFAHVYYPDKRVKHSGTYAAAMDALEFDGSVILLCKKCHDHPEKYLKELIDLRKKLLVVDVVN